MWTKICGFKDFELAEFAANAGVEAIGLNFYSKSPRCVDLPLAEKISKTLSNKVLPIGLFVNQPIEDVSIILERCKLPVAQFHGDETVEYLSELYARTPNLKIIKAFRIKEGDYSSLKEYVEKCQEQGIELFACLVDAYSDSEYGGTGKPVHWSLLRKEYQFENWPPLILAGGLSPKNIREAIHQVQPWGVDIASGVESSAGVKDPELILKLILEIQESEKV